MSLLADIISCCMLAITLSILLFGMRKVLCKNLGSFLGIKPIVPSSLSKLSTLFHILFDLLLLCWSVFVLYQIGIWLRDTSTSVYFCTASLIAKGNPFCRFL